MFFYRHKFRVCLNLFAATTPSCCYYTLTVVILLPLVYPYISIGNIYAKPLQSGKL